MAFLFILGQALPAHLVGGCGAGCISQDTYLLYTINTEKNKSNRKIVQKGKGKLGCIGQEGLTATTTSSGGFTLSRTGVE